MPLSMSNAARRRPDTIRLRSIHKQNTLQMWTLGEPEYVCFGTLPSPHDSTKSCIMSLEQMAALSSYDMSCESMSLDQIGPDTSAGARSPSGTHAYKIDISDGDNDLHLTRASRTR